MSKDKETELGVYASCLMMGIATLIFGGENLQWMGYGLGCLGSSLLGLSVVNNINPYKKLFEGLKLKIGDNIPRYLGKRKTDYGYCLTFSLPYGLSTDDFKKHQLAIEQYLNHRIEIGYKNYRVFIKVFEKELKQSPKYEFIKCKNTLELPIGIGFGGRIITLDLEKAVHLLIAGETGSGKSTILRTILTSLILANKRVSLHLIDLKNGAEFNVFRKCKQVKTFSRTKEEAKKVLTDLINEVDRRYDMFYENNVVDIREYNKLKNVRRLNYKIIIIDEYADLQEEKGSTAAVEELAAKARACGIHLIISTQRPDMKILNGRIKANIPSIIGLKTMNQVNSRIIIDEGGLENLRGKGHGLLRYGKLTEFQGMYLSVSDARELIKKFYVEKSNKITTEEKVEEIKDFSFLKKLG